MATITTRAGKGTPLTNTEVDNNFTNLNTDKIENVVEDTTPQLGGNLDLNSNDITGTGNINVTGTVTADENITIDTSSSGNGLTIQSSGNTYNRLTFDANRSASGNLLGEIMGEWNGTQVAAIRVSAGSDTTNKDDGQIYFLTSSDGTGNKNRVNIANNGDISFYEDTGSSAKFFWDASTERLGLGTTIPSHNIDVTSSQTASLRLDSTTYGADFILYSGATGADKFGIYDADASAYRLIIDNVGNVGIGTTSPAFQSGGGLHVHNSSVGRIHLTGGASGTSSTDGFELTHINSDSYVWNYETGPMIFGTGNTERMRLDASGNLGLGGQTSPQFVADFLVTTGDAIAVRPTAGTLNGTQTALRLYGHESVLTSRYVEISSENGGGTNANNMVFKTATGTTVAERMRITDTGNVGIGTDSPEGLISFPATASNTPKFRLQSATSNVDVAISSYADANGTYASFGANNYLNSSGNDAAFDATKRSAYVFVDGRNLGAVTFGTAASGTASERMRLDASGNLLVGTTDGSGFTTSSTNSGVKISDGIVAVNGAGGSTAAGYFNVFDDGTILDFRKDGTTVGIVASRGGVATNLILRTATGQGAGIGGANSGVLPCDEDGLQDDEINLGASGTRWKDLYLSGVNYIGDLDSGSAGTTGKNIQSSQNFSTVYSGSNATTWAGMQLVNHDDTSNRTSVGLSFVHRSSSSGIAGIQSTSDAGDRADIRFSTRSSGGVAERMVLDYDGNLLVGKTSSSLGTQGCELRAESAYFTRNGGTPVFINRETSDGEIVQFRKDNASVGSIGTISGDLYIASSNSGHEGLKFGNGAITPVDSAGASTNAACNLGGATSKFADLYLSGDSYITFTDNNTFSASTSSWHNIIVRNTSENANNSCGIVFELNGTYHQNAGTGIAAVKANTSADYGADLVIITRPESAAAVERMRVTNTGNVGIGDTPQSFSKLQVKTDTNKQIAMFSNANGATVGGITDAGGSTTLRLAGSPLVMTGAGGAGSEAMRIDANGHVTIGRTSTASSATDFGHNFYETGQFYINSSSSGNSDVIRGYDSSGANTFAIDADGDYINLSDQRKKENIADIQIGLAEVMQLQPRQFDWIDSGEHVPSGFVAQEVQSVIPSAVVENDDGFLMMKDRQLIPVLTKALQEAVARIETLEAEVATLKGN